MNKMYSFTYLLIVISLIVHNQIDFIDATGDSKKIWLSDDKTGELETGRFKIKILTYLIEF